MQVGVTDPVASTPARVAEKVRAAAYGTVLVIAALGVTKVNDVAAGYAAELVLGVGAATWIAHLYAELLGRHVVEVEPLRRSEVRQAMVDGSPIMLATLLPGLVLIVGRGNSSASTVRSVALAVAFAQLVGIGILVARLAPGRPHAAWIFAAVTAGVGTVVGVATLALGH